MTVSLDQSLLLVGAAVGLAGAYTDVFRKRSISNRLTAPACILGVVAHAVLGGWHGLGASLGGVLAALVVTVIPFQLKAMCGGDVKLMAAVAAWAFFPYTFMVLFWAAMSGGIMALVMITIKREFVKRWRNTWLLLMHIFHKGLVPKPEISLDNPGAAKMPFGAAIGLGALIVAVLSLRYS